MRHTQRILILSAAYRKPSWKCLEKCQHILWLISSFKQRDVGEILAIFQGRQTIILIFMDSKTFDEVLVIFPRLSYR